MTGRLGSVATAKTVALVTGVSGINASLAALTLTGSPAAGVLTEAQVTAQNVTSEVAEKAGPILYPTVNVYCEKLVNSLVEKFRSFSGTIQIAIEIRNSQDRLEGLQDMLATYTDAVLHVLDGSRGDWGNGMYYAGAYQVVYGTVKQGGKHYIQTAKVTFELGVSIN